VLFIEPILLAASVIGFPLPVLLLFILDYVFFVMGWRGPVDVCYDVIEG
jgi:hypothetical protein